MSKTFRGTLLGGFRRRDVICYLETLDARQKEDLKRREREIEEAQKQADQACAELNAAREAAANLRAALAAQRTENARLSQRTGQLEAQQAVLQETLRTAGEEPKRPAAEEATGLHQLAQLCDRLDEALLHLDALISDHRSAGLAAGAENAPEEKNAQEGQQPDTPPKSSAVHHTAVSDLLDKVRPR